MLALVLGSCGWRARSVASSTCRSPLAAVALFLLLVIGGTMQAGAVSDADGAVGTQLEGADRAAQARAAAFEARSQEALTLINRGNGAANEANWQRADDVVTRELRKAARYCDELSERAGGRVQRLQARPQRDPPARRRGQLGRGRRRRVSGTVDVKRQWMPSVAFDDVRSSSRRDRHAGGIERIDTARRRGLAAAHHFATSCSSLVSWSLCSPRSVAVSA